MKPHKHSRTAKSSKPLYSQIIYDEIRTMKPPGRFLKQDPKTKLWHDIGKKAALAKTRQALREGAPDILMDMKTAARFRQTLAQDLNHQSNSFANVTSDSTKATLSNYLPRSESNASISSDSLLSLSSSSNKIGTFQFSGPVPNQVSAPTSLVSSISGDRNYQVQMQNDWQHQLPNMPNAVNSFGQVPSVLQFINTAMPAMNSQSNVSLDNGQNLEAGVGNVVDYTNPVNQPTSNDTVSALMSLLTSINSNNAMMNQNMNQMNIQQQQTNCAQGSLLQQLQSQQAYQQLVNQLGLPQHSSQNDYSSGMANSA